MKKWLGLFCITLVLSFTAAGFALEPILIGNFETDMDDFWNNTFDEVTRVTEPAAAVTKGNYAIKCYVEEAYWGNNIEVTVPDKDGWIEALMADDAVIAVDATAFAADISTGGCNIGMTRNMDTSSGWDREMDTAMIIDGEPHTYYLPVSDATKEQLQEYLDAIENGESPWGANIGIGIDSSDEVTVYMDNIWIYPEGPVDIYGPHSPSTSQTFNVDPAYVDFTLEWKAAADPGDPNRLPDPNVVYAVNPDIVDQYVFYAPYGSTDPNLFYLGATGEDPGTEDPNSEYGSVVLPVNTKYQWAVVEAMDGFEHEDLVIGVSTLEDVDPNNIIGPVWTISTLSTVPSIDTQPVDTRFDIDDTQAQFSIGVISNTTPIYQWYYSLDEVIDESDNPISAANGGDTDTLTISIRHKAYQAYFYCKVGNSVTVSGGGEEADIYSDVASLVVERKVAEYLFEGDLADTGDGDYDGTAQNGAAVVSGDSVEGSYALQLDGLDQYVELDPNAFPKASLLAKDGIGGGLDVGSILCWVKLDTAPEGGTAAIVSNQKAGWPATGFGFRIESDDPATYTNVQTSLWGDQENSTVFWVSASAPWDNTYSIAGDNEWHMLASTWDMNGVMNTYLDGNLINISGTGAANEFSGWDKSVLIGAAHSDTGITSHFDGLIDDLRIYNYVIPAEDIAYEYHSVTGVSGCIYLDFAGSNLNVDNTGSSYCKVDLADLAVMAQSWLVDGFYPVD